MSAKPFRVLYVHHSAALGGAPLSLLYLIQKLDRKQYAPTVLFNTSHGPAVDLFQSHDIPIVIDESISIYQHGQGTWMGLNSTRPWKFITRATQILPSARRFQEFLENNSFALVHLNSMVQVPAAIGAAKAGIPLIWHIREELHPGYLGLRSALVRRCIDQCADATVVISRQNASHLLSNSCMHVIYNFVDFTHFDRTLSGASIREELNIDADRQIVTTLGGIINHKGVDTFVAAAVKVLKKFPDALFLIAGTPPLDAGSESPNPIKRVIRRSLEKLNIIHNSERKALALINEHNLHEKIRFIGMRDDIPELLAASSLLVWSATVSHFARPIIEAGAMARPVVASDFPSSRELVEDGHTGILVPKRDAHSFASAIIHLLNNPEVAQQMGEQGYVQAKLRYDAEQNADATFAIYKSVLQNQTARQT